MFFVAGDSFVGCGEFELDCFFWVGTKFGLNTLVVSDLFCKIQRSWRFEERCTAVLCGSAFVMAVSAPDSGKDLEKYRKLVEEMMYNLHEGRRAGRQPFDIADDIDIE